MVKVLLISVNDTNAEGARSLSATLKQNGYQSYIVFLKRYSSGKACAENRKIETHDWIGIDERGCEFRYARGSDITPAEENLLLSLIGEIKPDFIGCSVTTPLKKRIADVSRAIRRKYSIPIIWGGPGPSIDPKDCLHYCDVLCVGEGEGTIVDIAEHINSGRDIREGKNIAYLKEGQLVQNPLHPLLGNLDELPFKDIEPENKFLIDDNSLIRDFDLYNDDRLNDYDRRLYRLVSSRGCPFSCSYCCEVFFKKLYFPQTFLRRRSPIHVINELKRAKEKVGYKRILFEDEVFSFDNKWLKEFKYMYKKEVDVPFICYIYPHGGIGETIKILKEMGAVYVCLGLQSGSARINKQIFHRPFDKDLFLKTACLLKQMKMDYYVDVITYNPFEEEADLKATLDVLNRLPRPFGLCVNKLYIMKGTDICDMAEKHACGKGPALDKIFNYYSRLFWATTKCDARLIRFLYSISVFRRLPFLCSWIPRLAVLTGQTAKAMKHPTRTCTKLLTKAFNRS